MWKIKIKVEVDNAQTTTIIKFAVLKISTNKRKTKNA